MTIQRREWKRLSGLSWKLHVGRRHQEHFFAEQRLQRHAFDRVGRIDQRHVHLAGHHELAQDMTETVVDVDDDLRVLRADFLEDRQERALDDE